MELSVYCKLTTNRTIVFQKEYKSIIAISAKTWCVSADEPCFGHDLHVGTSIIAISAKTWCVSADEPCFGHDLHVGTHDVAFHGLGSAHSIHPVHFFAVQICVPMGTCLLL